MYSPVELAMRAYKKKYEDKEIVEISGHGLATGKFLNDMGRLSVLTDTLLLWGDPVWEAKQESRGNYKPTCVWALIRVGNTTKYAGYNKETGVAYKADGYIFTWETWKRFEFVRFLRMQEL